jgi:hypothetical protein
LASDAAEDRTIALHRVITDDFCHGFHGGLNVGNVALKKGSKYSEFSQKQYHSRKTPCDQRDVIYGLDYILSHRNSKRKSYSPPKAGFECISNFLTSMVIC